MYKSKIKERRIKLMRVLCKENENFSTRELVDRIILEEGLTPDRYDSIRISVGRLIRQMVKENKLIKFGGRGERETYFDFVK